MEEKESGKMCGGKRVCWGWGERGIDGHLIASPLISGAGTTIVPTNLPALEMTTTEPSDALTATSTSGISSNLNFNIDT